MTVAKKSVSHGRSSPSANGPAGDPDVSGDHYRSLFEHAPIAIWEEDWSAVKPVIEGLREKGLQDIDGFLGANSELVHQLARDVEVVDFNAATVAMYRAPDKESLWKMIDGDPQRKWEFQTFCTILAAFIRGETRFVVEAWETAVDRSDIFVRDTVIIPDDFLHDWARVVHTTEDVTERMQVETALRESERRHQDLYDNAPDMYFTLSADATVLSVNQFGADYLGYAKEELVGRPVWSVVHPEDLVRVKAHIREIFAEGRARSEVEFRKLRKDRSILWVHERVRFTPGDTGKEPELRIVCRDVTEAHNLSEQLSYQASHDALTDLVNRREFEIRLGRVLDTARRSDTDHALCYLDLDQFKIINDTCGHIAGDELLRQLSVILQQCIRKRDTLARLGGDEFGVLMEHCSLEQAQRVAGSLRESVESFSFGWEDKSFSLGVSIGLVPITRDSGNVTVVLRAADTACYAAKDEGRNRIHTYQPNDADIARRFGEMQWVARINRAMEEDRLTLFWQRIVPMEIDPPVQAQLPLHPLSEAPYEAPSEGRERYELLLRMIDENGKLVLPRSFLPAAERYNLAAKIDRWVIRTAFEWVGQNPEFLDRICLCSINLSGQTLADDEFPAYVTRLFDETDVPPSKFCFEITETAAIANLGGASRAIKVLKEWGCRFALDDFGSGLSSFAYLKNLDVDYLKIDGMFVRDVADDPIDLAMVRSINDIGHVMGKHTIAECVESEAIFDMLAQIGVDFAQGYCIDRPCPIGQQNEES